MFGKRNVAVQQSDANLVMLSLGGDRDAFCEIVSRYQVLLCSLAYSSLGDLKHSEDVAQDVFVEAWKKLETLKDPEKLRAWLCGILRFKVSHFRRKEQSQPLKGATQLDGQEVAQEEIEEKAIATQEQQLLWQTLDKMDSIYREPLILFYREQQSVEKVAEELDLSMGTAKQRLSRGRKLLKRAMSSFVEETLSRTRPGSGFTAAVLLAISGISQPAKAAALGGGAIKGSSFYKLATLLTFLASISGFISSYFGLKASLAQSRTQNERRLVIKVVASFISVAVIFVAAMFAVKYTALVHGEALIFYAWGSQLLVLGFVFLYGWLMARMMKSLVQLRAQERIFSPQSFQRAVDQKGASGREYKSKIKLLGVPLFHFQFAMPEQDDKPAFAWVAGGSTAYGLLFAWGGLAIAPISVGIVAFGVFSVGAVGVGVLSTGTVAIGFIGFGASAVAFKAYGSLSALGWESAYSGGISIAKQGAVGAVALAEHTNNDIAYQFANVQIFAQGYLWLLALIAILVIVPAAWHSQKVKQRMK